MILNKPGKDEAREADEFMTGQENKKNFFFSPSPFDSHFCVRKLKEHKVQSYTSLRALNTSSVTISVQP